MLYIYLKIILRGEIDVKKIILISLSVSLIICLSLVIYSNKVNKDLKIKETNVINIEEEKENEIISESVDDNTSGVEDDNSSIYNSNKNDMESDNASNSNVIKKEKKEEKKTSTQVVSKSNEENKKEVKIDNSENNTSPGSEEPKKQTPWEALGVSEYHYYNEPMYSWERVDFPISKYGSEANCRKACAEYGDNYEPYLNGEVLYSCSIVTSLSGKYLGEYFSTEKLN